MLFTDTKGRTIEIQGDFDIEAFHNGERIGCIQFDCCDGISSLFGMDVKTEFQKAGIGTEMMRQATLIHGKTFIKPDLNAVGGFHANSDSYYTFEGAKLIQRCIREGILDDTQSEFDYDDDGDDDL